MKNSDDGNGDQEDETVDDQSFSRLTIPQLIGWILILCDPSP